MDDIRGLEGDAVAPRAGAWIETRAMQEGFLHHVIQRGNNREKVFFNDEDRKRYLSLFRKYSEKWNSPILAFCLMTTTSIF